jgi:hypothetical protein
LALISEFAAGQRLTAAMLRAIAPLAAYKSADETVSTLTLQNDDALLLPVAANATYLFVMMITYTGGTGGSSDLKTAWALPSGASMSLTGIGWNTSSVVDIERSAGPFVFETSGSGTRGALEVGTIAVSSTAGTAQFQWCTNTTPAVNTTVHAGSVLAAWQIA